MSNKSIKAPGDEAGPWFLLGEVRTVRCWRGEDELSARRGAGNVSSRPEQGKTEYTPTKCLSALNHWYTSTHINDGQLITSVWLRDAFYLFISAPQQHPAPSARLEMGWYGIFHVDEDRMDCCLCHRYGISISVALWWEPVGMVWNRKLSFFFSSFNLPAAECRCCDRKLIYLHQCCMMVIRPVPVPTACSGGR